MGKIKLSIDFDEVIADLYGSLVPWWNEHHGTQFKTEDISDWDLDKTFGEGASEKIFKYMNEPGMYKHVRPLPEAINVMQKLVEAKDDKNNNIYDVMIVTAIPDLAPNTYAGKHDWIKQHMPFFNRTNYIAIKSKERVHSHIMFDDGPHNLKAFSGVTIAMDRPWNQKIKTAYRVKNWNEFYEVIRKLS